jgi:hypothetical protein
MKKSILLFFLFISLSHSTIFAQSTSLNKKQPTLSIHFILNDFRTAEVIKNSSFGQVLLNDQWSNFSEMSPGLALAYHKGISSHVDFMASLGASYAKFTPKDRMTNTTERLLLEADANVNVKLLPDNYAVTPFVTAGVGASLYGVHYGAYIPFGLGLQVRLGDDAFILTGLQYRTGITQFTGNHLNYSIGFSAPIGTRGN